MDILCAVQPPINDAARGFLLFAADLVQLVVQPFEKVAFYSCSGAFLFFGRHFAAFHFVKNLGPLLKVLNVSRLPLKSAQVQTALLHIGVVALVAVLLEHGLQFAAEFRC